MATATSSTTPSTAIATSAATATSATTTSAATATSAATTSATSFTATCISSTDRTPVTSTTMSKALSQTSTVSSSVISPAERSLNDPLVELEGWVRLWENHNGIPPADLSWVMKDDTERGLFSPIQVYQNSASLFKRRRVMKSDRMWCYPREPPGYVSGSVPAVLCQPHTSFSMLASLFGELFGYGNTHLSVLVVKNVWVLESLCTVTSQATTLGTKAARSGNGGRWLASDSALLCQLR